MRSGIRAALVVTAGLLTLVPMAAAVDVTFTYVPSGGRDVQSCSLRGTMNGWGETAMTQGADGSWSVTVNLAEGEHQYKFFINGEWPGDMETEADGGPLDPDAMGYVDDGFGGQNAVRIVGKGAPAPAAETSPAPPLAAGFCRIHYHRPDGAYNGWGLHLWEHTTQATEWTSPMDPGGRDEYGLWWDVGLRDDAERVGFILHRGEQKDPGPDMFLVPADHGFEVWIISGRNTIHTEKPDVSRLALGDLTRRRAYWLDAGTMAWDARFAEGSTVRLHWSAGGGMDLEEDGVTGGESMELASRGRALPGALGRSHPHLAGYRAFEVPASARDAIPEMLRGQLAVSIADAEGILRDATGVQIPGVLDDLFAYEGPLGIAWADGIPTLRLWAPTANSVRLHVFDSSSAEDASSVVPMVREGGVWTARGRADWRNLFYLYEVEVWVPSTGRVERNLVTDPYSRGLSVNSRRSQLVDLNDPALMPEGWGDLEKPPLAAPEDIVLYELHVRDFSMSDPRVPEELRGTFRAFAEDGHGSRHLGELARAGLTHVHLLPAFDIATINEDKSTWPDPGDLAQYPADSERQQAIVDGVRTDDGYNWGYDPFHFGVPEGSYSTDPDGSARVREFREMVKALADAGLRVVMDVVYNHTHASGQADRSVLDRVVPGYYHRLNTDGAVETSTCCQNTATEHFMMERLMVDDLVHWAVDYKVDGFRFDLMGHHMKRNLVAARDRLHALTPERDGVDGSAIYLYGEGWDFGEVGGGARGPNATQPAMAGTGIGTFNDRIRDAVRGGNPFGDRREQGFCTGLYVHPNAYEKNRSGSRRPDDLLRLMDRIRTGLAGNLRSYRFTGRSGLETRGSEHDNGGYTADPQETINYASAHDNETLFDKIQLAAPAEASRVDRARMQQLALGVVALGQGIPFFHAGSEALRSKSMDRDSYDHGDWFNRLDYTFETNNFGVGLPMADKNRDRWNVMRPLLADESLRPRPEDIRRNVELFAELLRIRRSSALFRLRTAADVQARVVFHNTGRDQVPGLVVMGLSDRVPGPDLDPNLEQIVVFFNSAPGERTFDGDWKDRSFRLHPDQANGRDGALKRAAYNPETGAFRVPGLSIAVFVAE